MLACSSCSTIDPNAIHDIVRSVDQKIFEQQDESNFPTEGFWDDRVSPYVLKVFNKVQSASGYTKDIAFQILKTDRVQAFGGYDFFMPSVRVTRGMLNSIENEAELVGLLAHEIGHLKLNHLSRRNEGGSLDGLLSQGMDVLRLNPSLRVELEKQKHDIMERGWSRALEIEADQFGVEVAAKAGYDPYEFCKLLERLSGKVNKGFLYRLKNLKSDHPALDVRSSALKEYLRTKKYAIDQGIKGEESYQSVVVHLLSMRRQGSIVDEDMQYLVEVSQEIVRLQSKGERLTTERFLDVMKELGRISRANGISQDELYVQKSEERSLFMADILYQDVPVWIVGDGRAGLIRQKIQEILTGVSRVGVGFIPLVGNAISLHEMLTGKDFFSGASLSIEQRTLSALSVFIAGGKAWRGVAVGIKHELTHSVVSKVVLDVPGAEKGLSKAVEIYEDVLKESKFLGHTPPQVGQKVYRIYGDRAGPKGRSWTPIDPNMMKNPRAELGLPTREEIKNSGRFVIEGRVKSVEGVKVQPADPLDGNPGMQTEYRFLDPELQIEIERVSGVNKEF